MPEIDQTPMVLMGLGHGAYLGKKIAGNGGSQYLPSHDKEASGHRGASSSIQFYS